MKIHQSKETAKTQTAGRIWLKLALIAGVGLLLIVLPQIFSVRAGDKAKPSAGLLFLVNTTDDHNDFSCDSGDCTLAEAIDASNNAPTADTISFSVTGAISLTTALSAITDSVTIQGPGADLLTVQPSSFFRIFNVTTTGTVAISGLTLTRGIIPSSTGGVGGAILNGSSGTVKVDNCTLMLNQATLGGGIANASTGTVNVNNCMMIQDISSFGDGAGIFNDSGTVTVTNSTFSDCFAGDGGSGGGIVNYNGVMNVTNCTFSNNFASRSGGGIANINPIGIVNVTNCTISDNRATNGGGVFAFSGTVNITNSTLSGNSASVGGGIENGGTVTVTNSTISGNSANSFGGGIFTRRTGTTNVSNSTVSGNSTGGNGGGLAIEDNSPDPITGIVNMKSSIVSANTANIGNDVHGPFTSQGFNLISRADFSTGFTQPTDLTGNNGIPLNPLLDPNGLQDNGGPTKTIALLCGSPAIDKGTSASLTGSLTTDQRGKGFPRTIDDSLTPNAAGGDGTDIGAFELQICNHPPVAQCKNVQISANNSCQASVTAAQVDNGSFDPDPGDSIAMRTLTPSGPFHLGVNPVTLTVTDTHGAISSCMATITVVDTTPPTITCPANIITQTTIAGGATVVVNYPPPPASDNCSMPAVVCSPPSGAQFPLGSTVVTCTATDAASNTATCTFTVTIFDVCLQDDSTRDTLLFNSQTGDYLYRRCGAGGFSLSGRGSVRVQGSTFTLEHIAADRRVAAKVDNSQKKGTASVQTFSPQASCTITDKNTADNACGCS